MKKDNYVTESKVRGYSQRDIAIEGMLIALVFLGTFYFKIPTAFGYTHLGDCMIILATCLLGTKRGVIAGALGAGLSDLIGGYVAWVIPTMIIKSAWVLVSHTRWQPYLPYPCRLLAGWFWETSSIQPSKASLG